MKRRQIITAICLLSLLLISVGTIYLLKNRNSSTHAVRLGAILPLTGSNANYGEMMQRGIVVALDEYNAHRNYGPAIEVIIEDSKSNPKDGVTAFQKLIQVDNTPAIMPVLSPVIVGCIPIAERNKIVILNCPANSPKLRGASQYVFNLMILADQDSHYLADFAFNKLKARRVGLFFVNNDGGRGYRDAFEARFKESGGNVVASEGHAQGSTEFRTTIEKFRAAKVDLVFMSSYYSESALFLKQCRELSYKTKWLSYASVDTPDFLKIADGAADGLIFSQPGFDTSSTNAEVSRFVKAYRIRYGQAPDLWGAQQYEGTMLLASAVASGARSGEDIRKYLASIHDYVGIFGKFSFAADGTVSRTVRFLIVRGNKFQEVDNGS